MNYPMSNFFDDNYLRMHFYCTNMREWTSITIDVDSKEVLAYGEWDEKNDAPSLHNITNKKYPPLVFMQIVFECDDMEFES